MPPPFLPVDLILAFPRPIMLKRILRSTLRRLVLANLHIIQAGRVEKSFLGLCE